MSAFQGSTACRGAAQIIAILIMSSILRQAGNDIETTDVTLTNGKTIAQYSLKVNHGQAQ